MKVNMPITDKEIVMNRDAFLVTRTNLEGIITYANDAFVEVTGFSREELIGSSHNITRHPDVSEELYRDLWKSLKANKPWKGVIKNRAKNGDYYWTETNITPIFTNGKAREYLAVRYAINPEATGRAVFKQEKRKSKTSKTRSDATTGFSRLLKEISIWKKGTIAMVALILPNIYLLYEFLLDRNFLGIGILSFLIATGFIILRDLLDSIDCGLEAIVGISYRFLNDSFKITMDLSRKDQLGDCYRALFSLGVKFNADLASSRESEKHLKEKDFINNDYIRQIEAIDKSQPIVQFKMDGTIINANDLFLNATGYTRAEIIGKHHRIFVDPEYANSLEYKRFWEQLNHGRHDIGEYKRVGKGGKTIYLRASYNPILDNDGRPYKVVKYAADVTQETLSNQTLEKFFSDIGHVMENLANGDLTQHITNDYAGIYGRCKDNVNEAVSKFDDVFSGIREVANFVATSSQEISAGNNNLSHRAEQQAANLEETAASMEQLTSIVKNTAINAKEANQIVNSTRDLAIKGGDVVKLAIAAMQDINESSNQIAEIISVIDEIAFQTNLLALNASVEAARAGEQGRGFSVVASEVRNLAQRSAVAAKQSSELIQNSVQKVRTGTSFVNQTGQALNEIVESVGKANEIVGKIAVASTEQTSGIDQVNLAVVQLDEITQQNAALAEQASAASISMSEQINNMISLLNFFKMKSVVTHQVKPHTTAISPMPSKHQAASVQNPVNKTIKHQVIAANVITDDEWEEF